MNLMISITTRRQALSRSWFWASKLRAEQVDAKTSDTPDRIDSVGPVLVKQASWPHQRAIWLPPQA